MSTLASCEKNALSYVRDKARQTDAQDIAQIRARLGGTPYRDVDPGLLADGMLRGCSVTLTFHPDRYSGNHRQIMDNPLEDGEYRSQFVTGTTNGGKTAFAGGDSSANPEAFGVKGSLFAVINALLADVDKTGGFPNREPYTVSQAVAHILSDDKGVATVGGNLDHCIEVRVHGPIRLAEDVDSLHLDESFAGGDLSDKAMGISKRYGVRMEAIPERKLCADALTDDFRGQPS